MHPSFSKFEKFIEGLGVTIEYRSATKSHSYYKELIVLKING